MNEESPQKQVINPNSPLFEKQALLEKEQMRPELILEAPGAAASENVEPVQEQVPEQTEIAPEIKPEPELGLSIKKLEQRYREENQLTKNATFSMLVEVGEAVMETEEKIKRLKNPVHTSNGNGTNFLTDAEGFKTEKTSEQNPVPDFNKFSRGGFKPVESNIPEQILKSVLETTLASMAVTPEPVQEAALENFLPDPATLKNEVKGGDIIIKVLKEDLEK